MPSDVRPMRADAIRNRAKILDAARSQIELHGPDVSMEVIASAGGVAVGTLYRHFPTKVDLVAAVLSEYTERMITGAHHALALARDEELTPLQALAGFLVEVFRVTAQNAAAKAAAPALGASINIDESEAAKALEDLIALGIASGEVRPDLTVADVYLLVTSTPGGASQRDIGRWSELVLPSITAAAAAMNLPREAPPTTA
ncbi:TetR/AcrR family transcriptional regulator [Kocuria marina]|uniref:Transcriptional regulator, TetR family n=1 Tax=Kocuria marina subsp. indica TaxID=1049583 RepID=A0A1X7EEF5_9MICC|nr:TetR/AcrR family transcriptional regulator [Kocuria indica]OXS78858.1 hypothetical protein B1B07_12740 [Kocuria indica]RLP56573.1 TetR/AcrR family transcriptional regulator [Kocuria indica]SMF32506.1 transcriptional regulator, TetR family [Kocuria indica]